MYKNYVDVSKNRLYVVLQGKMEAGELTQAAAEVLRLTRQLKPGFSAVSDLSGFVPTTEEGRLVMQGLMKAITELGVGHVVRVVPASAQVVANQVQRTTRTAGYVAEQVPTLQDAESLLDELEKG